MRSVIKAPILEPEEGVSQATNCLARAHPLLLFCPACNEIARQGEERSLHWPPVTCLHPPPVKTTGGAVESPLTFTHLSSM